MNISVRLAYFFYERFIPVLSLFILTEAPRRFLEIRMRSNVKVPAISIKTLRSPFRKGLLATHQSSPPSIWKLPLR